MKQLACTPLLLLLVLTGCKVTQSLEKMPQDLEDVAALEGPMEQVAALKEPLAALGSMATITQPATYVPMFGFIGIVLFLAIWGGIKMGRR